MGNNVGEQNTGCLLGIRLSTPKGETEIRSQARAPIDLDGLRRHFIGSDDDGKALTNLYWGTSQDLLKDLNQYMRLR